jgi:hypothetical protein
MHGSVFLAPEVQLAATASKAPPGVATRSATPTFDPESTHKDPGACEEDGEVQDTAFHSQWSGRVLAYSRHGWLLSGDPAAEEHRDQCEDGE